MINTMFDYIGNLPPLAQFILIALALAGTPTGLIAGLFAVWKIRISSDAARQASKDANEAVAAKANLEKIVTEQKVRLETLELKQFQIQSQAEQARIDRENTQRLIEGNFRKDEGWQKVVDAMSERKHEENKQLADALNRLSTASENLTAMVEIHSEHLGELDSTVEGVRKRVDSATTTMEQLARDNRHDITTALGLSVTYRSMNDGNLEAIKNTIHSIVSEITRILEHDKKQNSDTLLSIKNRLQSIESAISTRPALLTPLPESTEPALPASVNTETSTPETKPLDAA